MKKSIWTITLVSIACVLPLIIYVILSLQLKDWLVDDAGISFSYSRSLASGYGLVPQQGAERVEGYSNFLWVLLYSPFFIFNSFDPYITPKIVSAIIVGFVFIFIIKVFKLFKVHPVMGLITNYLIAFNAPFVIWTCSGLENPLYVLLIVVLVYLSLKYTNERKANLVILSAITVFMISITRPDGIVFACIFPFAILLNGQNLLKKIKPLGVYLGMLVVLIGGFLLFRLAYFNDWVPNTYYAKEASTKNVIRELFINIKNFNIKYHSIFRALGGSDFISIFYFFALLYTVPLFFVSQNRKLYLILLCAWFASFLIYMLLPYDFMGEYRFATAFVVLTIFLLCLAATNIVRLFSGLKKVTIPLLLCFVVVYSFIQYKDHYKRLMAFKTNPTVPFNVIKTVYSNRFDAYASVLNLKDATLLLPDVGAAYYYSHLIVYDAAGLCDKTIAKAKFSNNKKLIRHYVFEQLKPTFIHLHDGWAELIRPDAYSGFRTEYMPIFETMTTYYSDYWGENIYSGDYIRRDVITKQNWPILREIIKNREHWFD